MSVRINTDQVKREPLDSTKRTTYCTCGQALGRLDIPCHGWGRTPAASRRKRSARTAR